MLGKGAQRLLGGPARDGDVVKGALAHLAQLLLLDDQPGPLAAAGVERGEVKAESIDDLAGQVPDGVALAVGRVLGDDELQIDERRAWQSGSRAR